MWLAYTGRIKASLRRFVRALTDKNDKRVMTFFSPTEWDIQRVEAA
jgi:hypothetical protein